MAFFTILRAVFGYLFLILIVRIVGRRPGEQLTPFEFVLIFYLGGLTLTGMIGNEFSLANSICQIITVALCHCALTMLRFHFTAFAKLLDGVPLVLLENNSWRTRTLSKMRIQDDDVMDMAREQGLSTIDEVGSAVLETSGGISIIKRGEENK